jgi:hypothetical protein
VACSPLLLLLLLKLSPGASDTPSLAALLLLLGANPALGRGLELLLSLLRAAVHGLVVTSCLVPAQSSQQHNMA